MNKCKVIHETFITELNDTIYFFMEKGHGCKPTSFFALLFSLCS